MALQVFDGLEVTLRRGLQIIKFNRPKKKNSINVQMYEDIAAILKAAGTDDRVVMTALTGEGDFYSSGNDISSALKVSDDSQDMTAVVKERTARFKNFISAFIDYPKILVAVVNGPAIGVAATTLGLCDAVYASDKAYFYTPFTKLGLVAEGCSSYTFPRIMGTSKAGEMLYFGHRMSASEALKFGLVSEVYPSAIFQQEIWPKIEKYALLPKQSMRISKSVVRARISEELHKANELECKELEARWSSEEAMNAVLEFFNSKNKL